MRCVFDPELIPALPHSMMKTFPKTEIIDDLSESPRPLHLSLSYPNLWGRSFVLNEGDTSSKVSLNNISDGKMAYMRKSEYE
jgi:hypothetical protein